MFLFKSKKIDTYEALLKACGALDNADDGEVLYKSVSNEFGEETARTIFGFFLGYFKTVDARQRISAFLKDVKHPLFPWITERNPTVEEALRLGVAQVLAMQINAPDRISVLWSDTDHTWAPLTVFEEREAKADWNI